MTAALFACPDCPPAREARHMVLHNDLLRHVVFAALPFLVTLVLVVLVVRALSKGSGHGHDP